MNHYFINSKNLADFGFIPGRAPQSTFAISGAWDMPARIGKVYHEWPDLDGVEPYLRADELFYGGRDIVLHGFVKAVERTDAYNKVQLMYDELEILSGGLFTLSCDWGEWEAQVLQQIQVGYISNGFCSVSLVFREPVVGMGGIVPESTDAPIGIDGISFSDLGLVKMLTAGSFNRADMRQAETTSFEYERIGVVKRGLRTFNIQFFIKQADYVSFVEVIQGLMALFSSPGARTLRLDDGTIREFFVKDGFRVINVRKVGSKVYAFIDITFAEIRLLENWNLFTDQNGLILTDGNGRPLTEILKGF